MLDSINNNKNRCGWVSDDELYKNYHDIEWGRPVKDDRLLFEYLILEGAQAGLSWITVLRKRENYRRVFDNFDAEKIIKYDDKIIAELVQDASIIRNKLKIMSVVINAKSFLIVREKYGSFSDYIWQITDNKTINNKVLSFRELPARTAESDALSKMLKKDGFKFVGTTICYAFMQAVGMVNDHELNCFCRGSI